MNRKFLLPLLLVALLAAIAPSLGEGVFSAREVAHRYARLEEVYEILREEYYEELDEDVLITGAIRGMMDAVGDRYTYYYTPEEMAEEQTEIEGSYEGIGLLISADQDGNLVVLRVYEDSPASEAGILAYDIITAVNGETVSAATEQEMNEAVEKIRASENGTNLTLSREGEEYAVTLYKRVITMNRVYYEMLEGDIGYIALFEFVGNDVEGFLEAEEYFKEQGATGLILDLRDNPGGMLDDVLAIADEIVPEGEILTIQDRYGNSDVFSADAEYWDIPIVVLINGNSASASEVLTGALKDHDRATVIGETSFGKGIVQTIHYFDSDGAGMQYTTGRYFTPSGSCIHDLGIEPDITVVADAGDPAASNQLQAAIEYLLGG
ncbi:MAG: S41 family peptidase [Christensenellales bacterium]|jgi:carboxyl-terminal processing protease